MRRLVQGLVGGFAAFAIVGATMAGWISWLQYRVNRSLPADSIEVVFHWHGWRLAAFFLVVFAGGFYWRYERGSEAALARQLP